ncbi:hypothetical protein AB205_0177670, partial [Aquarana catesbeiana]
HARGRVCTALYCRWRRVIETPFITEGGEQPLGMAVYHAIGCDEDTGDHRWYLPTLYGACARSRLCCACTSVAACSREHCSSPTLVYHVIGLYTNHTDCPPPIKRTCHHPSKYLSPPIKVPVTVHQSTCHIPYEYPSTCHSSSKYLSTCHSPSEYLSTCYSLSEYPSSCHGPSEYPSTCHSPSEYLST